MKLNTSPVALPPMIRRRSSVVKLPCLCNCGHLTGGRFAPGHDAKIQSLALAAELGARPGPDRP